MLLNQVVNLKAECYHWSKLRKETAEEYLTRFLDSEVKLLWPKGWISTKILFKESKEGHAFITLVFNWFIITSRLLLNLKKWIWLTRWFCLRSTNPQEIKPPIYLNKLAEITQQIWIPSNKIWAISYWTDCWYISFFFCLCYEIDWIQINFRFRSMKIKMN